MSKTTHILTQALTGGFWKLKENQVSLIQDSTPKVSYLTWSFYYNLNSDNSFIYSCKKARVFQKNYHTNHRLVTIVPTIDWMNDWYLLQYSALLRLYWAWDNLGQWDEFCYEPCQWHKIDRSTCWPAVQRATTVPRMPPVPTIECKYEGKSKNILLF